MKKVFLGVLLSFYSQVVLFAEDIYEPNDSLSLAKEIAKGTYSLGGYNEDWFKLNLTTGSLNLVMTPSSNIDLNMVLYNSNNQVVAANWTSSAETINYDVLASGIYYIKVEPTSAQGTNYSLSVDYDGIADDTYEPNNSLSQAITVEKGTYSLTALDDDWFKIDLSTGTLDLIMTPSNGIDINMALYDSDGSVVAANWVNSQETINYDVVTSGTYYIKIEPASVGVGAGYSLNIDYSSIVVWQTQLEFGPIRDVSVALFDIDKDGKDEIFVGTSKTLDSDLTEIRPAGLICLEDDGTVKWTKTFPAMSTADTQTGKVYNTTSVSSAPFFSDLDGDGKIDILVGVGADTFGEAGADVVGQPGDKGGLYALNSDGSIKWFHESLDTIGGTDNIGDGRPDGVYGSAVVYDLDKDGVKEVIYNGWDQYMWILNAVDGTKKLNVHLLDTIWSTPRVADINEDGNADILVTADITENSDALTTTGGIFHVLSADGKQNISGFDNLIGNPLYDTLLGKTEEQALWSSPVTADIDGDGHLEIAYGTGNFFHDARGTFIKVWNHDGTLKFKLDTIGRTFSTPIIADIDLDGDLEILATTLEGYLYCWDHTGAVVFATQTKSYKSTSVEPIFSSPIAVDTNGNGKLEIIYAQGAQVVMVDYLGTQISDNTKREMVFEQYKGSVAIKDIDNDGVLDLISGGSTEAKDQAVVYRWNVNNGVSATPVNNTGRYQLFQSNTEVQNFVKRFYQKVLNREADTGGLLYWTDELITAVRAGSDVAKGFIFSQEFTNRGISDDDFLTILYEAFFNRAPDEGGLAMWKAQMQGGETRSNVLDGFLYSQEFGNLCKSYGILPVK